MRDFLVIGGGIAGISAAARLSELGTVTVLEAEGALGYHATGRSAAVFLPDYGNEIVRALNYASYDYLDSTGLLSPREMMLLAKHDERELFEEEFPSFNMAQISIDEAAEKFPILNKSTVAYAAFRSGIYDLDHSTRRYLKRGAKRIRIEASQLQGSSGCSDFSSPL